MGKEQICPFSLKAELIGIWDSVRGRTVPLSERLKGTVDNLRSTRREAQDQLAYSAWEYQEGVDRRGQPDLVHPRFGSMTDSLLRFAAIQNSPERRKIAKTQLRQWLLIKEAALELKDGGAIYAFIPKMIEIEDGAALMRLRKDGDHFLAQSRLLSQDFDQEKAFFLFEKFKEKGFKIEDLTSDEPSLIFRIAKGEKENPIDLKDDLPQILTEFSRPVLTHEFQKSQTTQPLTEFSPSISFSLFELVLPKAGSAQQLTLERAGLDVVQEEVVALPQSRIEKPQVKPVEFSLNQLKISVTHKSSLHNLQRSLENVQFTSVGGNAFIKNGQPLEEKEEISVEEEQAFIEKERQPFLPSLGEQILLDMKQREMGVEAVNQPIIREEKVIFVRGEELEKSVAVGQSSEELQPRQQTEREMVPAGREEMVVFKAAGPVAEMATSAAEPFVFIRNEPRIEERIISEIVTPQLLQQTEEAVLPVLVVPDFWQAEQTVRAEEKIFQGDMQGMIEKEIDRRERQKKITEPREEKIVLPETEVWAPKIVRQKFPASFFSPGRKEAFPKVSIGLHLRGVRRGVRISDWGLEFRRKAPNWIELLTPKEIGIVTAIARDKFGINDPFSLPEMADSVLFWLLGMSLFAQKPALYKLELDFTPLTVNVKDGKFLVARKTIPEGILRVVGLLAEERQFPPRPALFLTT